MDTQLADCGKTMKLITTRSSGEDILFSPKDFPDINIGDIMEVHHPGDGPPWLLVQVKQIRDDYSHKDSVSIVNTLCKRYELRSSKEVIVRIVKPREVAADLVEMLFKDQYFSRADMWRMRKSLVGSCVHHGQPIEFTDMRAQVDDIWMKECHVSCAAVTDDTRFVFRSSTAQVNIFIQMSAEMWEFDRYGDLYWEKTLDGFLVDLFAVWKDKSCNHDVTITLFSRQFYVAQSIDEFPPAMRSCIQVDYLGRFYEDFYRVVVQNERYDDWTRPVKILRRLFNEYNDYVLHFHECNWSARYAWKNDRGAPAPVWNPSSARGDIPQPTACPLSPSKRQSTVNASSGDLLQGTATTGVPLVPPRAYNSTAAEGNVLEVLNMALNVFEKYFIDRGFERTGKLCIVITPGQGIFEVDRNLMNITKQRTIDGGCSSDLVCMGEKPLHAVPLFKFHNRTTTTSCGTKLSAVDIGDDYNIPHWINYSFYVSRVQQYMMDKGISMLDSKLIKSLREPATQKPSTNETNATLNSKILPQYGAIRDRVVVTASSHLLRHSSTMFQTVTAPHASIHSSCANEVPYSFYDEHDVRVYKLQSTQSDFISSTHVDINRVAVNESRKQFADEESLLRPALLKFDSHSAPGVSVLDGPSLPPPPLELCPRQSGSADLPSGHLLLNGSSHFKHKHRALVNPFAPSRLHFQATSNRRRWAHAFPVCTNTRVPSSKVTKFALRGIGSSHEQLSFAFSNASTPVRHTSIVSEFKKRHARQTSDSSDTFSGGGGGFVMGSYKNSGIESMLSFKDGRMSSYRKEYAMPVNQRQDMADGNLNGVSPSSSYSARRGGTKITTRRNVSAGTISDGGDAGFIPADTSGSLNASSRPISLTSQPRVVISDHQESPQSVRLDWNDGGKENKREGRKGCGGVASSRNVHMRAQMDKAMYKLTEGDAEREGGASWFSSTLVSERDDVTKCMMGIDWKSLSIQPSLPLTTDYFPETSVIQRDYVISEYLLIPEDTYLDMVLQEGRKALTTRQVYNEMIYQRLAQGFQIVIEPPRPTSPPVIPTPSLSIPTAHPTPREDSEEHIITLEKQQERTSANYLEKIPGVIGADNNLETCKTVNVNSVAACDSIVTTSVNKNVQNMAAASHSKKRTGRKVNQKTSLTIGLPPGISSGMGMDHGAAGRGLVAGVSSTSGMMSPGIKAPAGFMSPGFNARRPTLCATSSIDANTAEETVILSIGRIFHKISLVEPRITVTRYTPRHHHSHQTHHCRYHFQVPDSLTYDVSWTEFTHEKLETYSWNYVDQYLCTRGEDDFDLKESLKYWRARYFLLPCNSSGTKYIMEGGASVDRCDVYADWSLAERLALVDGCIRFLEMANKLKRQSVKASSKVKDMPLPGSDGKTIPRICTSAVLPSDRSPGDVSNPASADATESGVAANTTLDNSLASLSAITVKKPLHTVSTDVGYLSSSRVTTTSSFTSRKFNINIDSPPLEIVEAMLDQSWEGAMIFLKSQPGLPPLFANCFVSGEAVNWAMKFVEGVTSITDGIALMQRIHDSRLICHASGERKAGFIYGFYLYCILCEIDDDGKPTGKINELSNNSAFEHEWCEVAVLLNYKDNTQSIFDPVLCHSDSYDVDCERSATFRSTTRRCRPTSATYKIVHVEIDPARKSDREEWGTSHYHRWYTPTAAFELNVEWLVATGTILGDLVMSWYRRSNPFGFHFLPVPADPFALPFTANSDPLRGPIFVPLAIECLLREGEDGEEVAEMFGEYPVESRGERLAMFQESILKRFGFMRDAAPLRRALCVTAPDESPPQYVHCTGGMFATFLSASSSSLLSSSCSSDATLSTTSTGTGAADKPSMSAAIVIGSSFTTGDAFAPSLQHQYRDFIAHQCNQQKSCGGDHTLSERTTGRRCKHVGFLWVWNFMLTKRWRSSHTGDDAFQDKVFSDFKKFCSNTDGRLRNFWEGLKNDYLRKGLEGGCNSEVDYREQSDDGGIIINMNYTDEEKIVVDMAGGDDFDPSIVNVRTETLETESAKPTETAKKT